MDKDLVLAVLQEKSEELYNLARANVLRAELNLNGAAASAKLTVVVSDDNLLIRRRLNITAGFAPTATDRADLWREAVEKLAWAFHAPAGIEGIKAPYVYSLSDWQT